MHYRNLLWLAAIVFLPVPTALLFSTHARTDIVASDLYIGTMLVGMIVMRLIQLEITHHCLAEGMDPLPRWRLRLEWSGPALMAIAFVVSTLGAGTTALWVMVLAFPLSFGVRALHHRHELRGRSSG